MTARARFGLAAALAGVYGICYPFIKLGLAYAPPLAFAALRVLAAGAVLIALLAALRRPVVPPRRLWPGVAALALMGTVLGYGAMFSSPGRTGAGLAAVLGNTTPLFAMLLAVPLLGEPLTRRRRDPELPRRGRPGRSPRGGDRGRRDPAGGAGEGLRGREAILIRSSP